MSNSFFELIIARLSSLNPSGSQQQHAEAVKFLSTELPYLFQKALLSGEYYSEAKTKLTEIQSILNSPQWGINVNLFRATISGVHTVTNQIPALAAQIQDHFIEPYHDLITNIQTSLDNFLSGDEGKPQELSIYENSLTLREALETGRFERTRLLHPQTYQLFFLGITLVYCDEYLECTDDFLKRLGRIKAYLKHVKINQHNEEVVELYQNKAAFLEYKILMRDSHLKRDGEKGDRSTPALDETNAYGEFKKKCIRHYKELTQQDEKLLLKRAKDTIRKEHDAFFIEYGHNANRFFNKVSSDDLKFRKKQIVTLLTDLNNSEIRLKSKDPFDEIAFKSLQNLMSSSIYGLDLEIERKKNFQRIFEHVKSYLKGTKSEVECECLAEFRNRALEMTDDGKFQDFYSLFLFIKFQTNFLNFLLKNAEKLIDDNATEASIPTLKKKYKEVLTALGQEYKDTIHSLKAKIGRIRSHEAKPIYLTRKECFTKYTWKKEEVTNGKLFLDSSYILPNNFEKILKKVESFEANLAPLLQFSEEAFDIALSKLALEKNIENVEDKLKGNEFRIIQTVALFVSIATFVLVSVKIFENKSGLESFAILIGLACCLFLFNFFINYMVFIQFKVFRKPAVIALGVVLILAPIPMAYTAYNILERESFKRGDDVRELNEKIERASTELKNLQQRVYRDSILLDSLRK
jgi:hypothetical protein